MLLAVVGVGAVRVPDVILVHLLPAVIVPFPVPAHLTVTHQGVTWGKVSAVTIVKSELAPQQNEDIIDNFLFRIEHVNNVMSRRKLTTAELYDSLRQTYCVYRDA